jgi:hypothetical protein
MGDEIDELIEKVTVDAPRGGRATLGVPARRSRRRAASGFAGRVVGADVQVEAMRS